MMMFLAMTQTVSRRLFDRLRIRDQNRRDDPDARNDGQTVDLPPPAKRVSPMALILS